MNLIFMCCYHLSYSLCYPFSFILIHFHGHSFISVIFSDHHFNSFSSWSIYIFLAFILLLSLLPEATAAETPLHSHRILVAVALLLPVSPGVGDQCVTPHDACRKNIFFKKNILLFFSLEVVLFLVFGHNF